ASHSLNYFRSPGYWCNHENPPRNSNRNLSIHHRLVFIQRNECTDCCINTGKDRSYKWSLGDHATMLWHG
ncbi:unnamed protein product, partial [Larinioides sclopetarius]